MKRSSGILMPVFSLPGKGGIGSLGKESFEFADFIHACGMSIWQVLPMGPTGYGESPYQSTSIYAGNPLLISLEKLREEHLVEFSDDEFEAGADPNCIDYQAVRQTHDSLLRRCYLTSYDKLKDNIEEFRRAQPWVDDFSLFTAVKKHFDNIAWRSWPDEGIRLHKKEAIDTFRVLLQDEVRFVTFCQFLFFEQWNALHLYCRKLGIRLFGDMPIYVAEDSADTWTRPDVFQLDKNRVPTRVAGVPPDYFSADGQLWGNPLYNWQRLYATHFRWWIQRMRHMAQMYDIVRIDHFIGLANYYSIPYGASTARFGRWFKAPGRALIRTLKTELPDLEIVAEDLGCVNDRVQRLIDYSGYPGMKVLVFGFDGQQNTHHPSNWVKHCIAYTGTHDNDTVLGYLRRADEASIHKAMEYTGMRSIEDGPVCFVRTAIESIADTVIIPMQDLLGLDNSARMNTPSTIGNNWLWRMTKDAASDELANSVYQLNLASGRLSE